jgi:hypothetical protein
MQSEFGETMIANLTHNRPQMTLEQKPPMAEALKEMDINGWKKIANVFM